MSAQLTLTDAEMRVLKKGLDDSRVMEGCGASLTEAETAASASAYRKLRKGLERPSVRRPR